MANQVEVEIVAKLDGVNDSLKKLEESSKKSGSTIGQNILAGISGGAVVEAFHQAGDLLKEAFSSVAEFAGKAINQAVLQENAINAMNQSLANSGRFSQAASEDIQNFAEHLQKTTTIADDQVLSLVSLASNFTKTNQGAKDLTKAAIELSAATGMGLDEALRGLGASLEGNVGRLGRQVPALRAFSEEQLKAGAAIKAVNAQYNGTEEAKINTFGGAISQLMHVFDDFEKSLGKLVTKSPVVRELIKFISEEFSALTGSIKKFGKTGDVVGDLIKKLLEFSQSVLTYVGAPLEFAYNIGKFLFLSLETGFASIGAVLINFASMMFNYVATPILDFLSGPAGKIVGFFDKDLGAAIESGIKETANGVNDTYKVAAEAANATVVQLVSDTNKSFDNLFDFNATATASKFVSKLQYVASQAHGVGKEISNNIIEPAAAFPSLWTFITNGFDAAFTKVDKRVGDSAKRFKEKMANDFKGAFEGFAQGFAGSFATIGAALVQGQNAFAAFGKALLGVFGDLAIKMGTAIFLMGLGTFDFAQAGIGLALIALGGALKALSTAGGGGAAIPATPTAASAGGGVAAGTSAPIGASTSSFSNISEDKKSPTTNVNVNIAGSVLGDKRTLGRDIADALNEAFGSDGITLARGALV